mmetsp:Transcript_4164/g.11865  ORF Transcript_4164/g.11865 Transcript_4164/m.11865 type:complete len:442 (+) Transcript_4164:147-1472(+)
MEGLYMPVATKEEGDRDEDTCLLMQQKPGRTRSMTWLQGLVENIGFQTVVGVVICANAVVVGLETDHPELWMWPVLEDMFLVAFVCELVLRLLAHGRAMFFSISNPEITWNYFDFSVVALGVTDRGLPCVFGSGQHTDHAKMGMLMRSFRLMRIIRIVRIIRMLKQLYLTATGFLDAIIASFWVTVLCSLVIYICAVMTTRLLGRPDLDDPLANLREQYFGTISASMLTLFQLMAYPAMDKFEPLYSDNLPLTVFVLFIIFGAFTVLSILTGVVSEAMLERSRMQEEERRFETERARTLFVRRARKVLETAAGPAAEFLDRSALDACMEELVGLCAGQYVAVRPTDLEAMFDLVDYRGTGAVEIEELLYSLTQLSADLRPMSILELRKTVIQGLHGTNRQIAALEAHVRSVDGRLAEVLVALRAAPGTPSIPSSLPGRAAP